MKKTILSLAALVALSASAFAAAPGPVALQRDQKGGALQNPFYSVAQITSTTETLVCSGKCILGAIILGTGPSTSTLRVRDTAAADGLTSSSVLGPYRFENVNTSPGNNPVLYPMLFSNGISVKLSAASNGEMVSVEYLDLD